ncbi:hypothetical protein KFL_008970020 [Klebsormidium nitens]|uniref:Uncharacterized protein n=1 Tax=Klebsormidium nitens TaxID=105231 RepID=A0A1Y1IPF3_KLENI|nr:hypothetical protein KFL_008970020 [Klebsormidium nitens]|eukprot:GAQ91982.1 hypothetical protein KFL_008970020 [Klebsormidium nitens]
MAKVDIPYTVKFHYRKAKSWVRSKYSAIVKPYGNLKEVQGLSPRTPDYGRTPSLPYKGAPNADSAPQSPQAPRSNVQVSSAVHPEEQNQRQLQVYSPPK